MNNFFRQLTLKAKLLLIVLFPLVFLIYLAIQLFNEKVEKVEILQTYRERIIRSKSITELVDEMQSERRFTFGYVVKKSWESQMHLQRAKTDEVYKNLLDNEDETLKSFPSYTMLNQLAATRERVDENLINPQEVMDYFTNSIFRLNNLNNISAGTINYLSPVRKELAGQKILSELVTYLGILRASIYYSLYKNIPPTEIANQLHSLYAIYNTFETEFRVKSSDASVEEYNRMVKRGNLRLTVQYLDTLIKARKFDTSFTAEKWWTVSANGVDEIRALQRGLLQQVETTVNEVYTKEKNNKNYTIVIILFIIAVVTIIVVYTIATLNKMLSELNVAALEIAKGVTDVPIHIESNDVIGSLANSIKKIDVNNKNLSDAALSIGSGNFDVQVVVRSDEDVLSSSIKKMKANLRQLNKEREDKLWINTGLININNSIAEEKNVSALAFDALKALVDHGKCEVGLFYVYTDNILEFVAGIAVPHSTTVPKKLKLGESLVGQVAIDKKVQHLKNVTDYNITIKSASAEVKPRDIILIPLVHNEVLEGVIEIASVNGVDKPFIDLAEQAQRSIAIAIQSAKNRERLRELLQQTQNQAEELQVQHSEMEHLNTELEAQTHKLQASEEELKVQQEELLQTNQELEERSKLLEERNHIIIERNLEIQQKAKELELSTKYKSEFLANMSHELRTPLNSILLLSRLLAENNNKNLSNDQVEYAQVIQSSGNGLLSLIDEILDLSKIESGKMELDYTDASIGAIAADLKGLFAPVAKEKNIEFSINVDEQVPKRIETDRMRLEQILKNLISNALKFTSKGEVSVSIKPGEKDSMILFSVKDTGIGIAKDKQQLIFEAFRQEDGSTRRKFGGTGLGLSISRELARLLGGNISLNSEPGKGSEFIVTIPVEKAVSVKDKTEPLTKTPAVVEEAISSEVEEAPAKVPGNYTVSFIPGNISDDRNRIVEGDKVILIVEDDTNFAKALLDYTRQKGYKGIVAVRGDEGVELALQYKPIGILLDIQLPVLSGWDVMEELKTNPSTRHIPVHIMSSNQVKKESLQKGAIDFINKPVALEQMQEVFKKIEHVITRQGSKVLIVEENPKHAKALAYFLETFNVNAEISGNINEGVNALKRDDVECVILDMGIPDSHGYETLETIKKNPGLENLPIIIFTGKNLSKVEEQKIKQYADSIVIKTAFSYKRILDEVSLFLHLVEEGTQQGKQPDKYLKLGALGEVLSNKTILIADDDVRNIFSLTKALEQHNMRVITAMDGKEALKQLEENDDVDVVLTDIMMPELDGYETIKRIRQNYKYKNLPVIAVTAKAMTGDREKCIQAGASDYISKPVDIDQLLSLLRVWLYERGF